MGKIRRISVGPDVKDCMVYFVGQELMNGSYKIHAIVERSDSYVVEVSRKAFHGHSDEILEWKSISKHTPHVVEYNLDI